MGLRNAHAIIDSARDREAESAETLLWDICPAPNTAASPTPPPRLRRRRALEEALRRVRRKKKSSA
jgi:hypothetical protein